MNRQGSSAVFLSLILATLMAITLSLVMSARSQAETSVADGTLHLGCDSVLSGYNYYVQRDYGLFLMQGTDSEHSRRLRSYVLCTLNSFDDINAGEIRVNAGRYSAVNTEPVRQQILDYMKSGGGIGLNEDDTASEDVGDGAGTGGTGVDGDSGNSMPARTLRHGPTVTGLPSRSLPDKSLLASAKRLGENMKNPSVIFSGGTNRYLLDSYILDIFNCEARANDENHFFRNEVEYILCGELSDEKNLKKTDRALVLLRTGLNLSHIYSDKIKTAAVAAAAEVLTPGILGTVTQAGIAALWAGAEALNDVKLLHSGYRVPIIKNSASWAVDLDSLIEGYNAESGMIKPSVNEGRLYRDYLRILLFTKDNDVTTARILDLIQINMRKNYDGQFLVQECVTGVSIDAKINGRTLKYDKTY